MTGVLPAMQHLTGCYQPEVIHWDREDLYNLIHAKA